MLLEIDIGNTRLKWRIKARNGKETSGFFCIDLVEGFRFLPLTVDIQYISIASVNSDELSKKLINHLSEQCPGASLFIAETSKADLGVVCGYDDHRKLGVDRWLGVIAAYNKFNKACCVVDIGTAITVDWINDEGIHLGGVICPSSTFMASQLLGQAHKIDFELGFKVASSVQFVGNSTGECVEAGVTLMAWSFLHYICHGHPLSTNVCFVFTGGGARDLLAGLDIEYDLVPDLVLDGLRELGNKYFEDMNK